jgi:hypothetical protein
VHASNEDKDNTKDSFYFELGHVFHQFPKYFVRRLQGKVGDIFKLATRNKSLHEISNDYGVGRVNFAMSKIQHS